MFVFLLCLCVYLGRDVGWVVFLFSLGGLVLGGLVGLTWWFCCSSWVFTVWGLRCALYFVFSLVRFLCFCLFLLAASLCLYRFWVLVWAMFVVRNFVFIFCFAC